MLSEVFLSCLVALRLSSAEPTAGGIDRTMSDGVTSLGYNVLYGDEDFTILNTVVDEVEKKAQKAKIRLNELIQPLPVRDVKCLMSADHYCSKDMKETKGIIIQAIKDDCASCSTTQKESAGKVIAAMMAHDPSSWKLFLTRVALLLKEQYIPKRTLPEQDNQEYLIVREEEVVNARSNRVLKPGAKVRVRRYLMEPVKSDGSN
ncbi:uncharacterized protein LOC125234793 [Leguminivora glycinivorella]|uniref:uncharacterized protein LOC125234793 n=1 Tax=Leguminivora glycinivorella TaxID=1035111 RepID=UPI00200F7C9E|nr:uncharacterized protein LOC125234793 [Leguminivora glycinivorella]